MILSLDQKQPARKYRKCLVCLPNMSGMRGSIKGPYPFGPSHLSLFSPTSQRRLTSVPSFWWPSVSTKKKKIGRLDRRRFASRLKAPGLGFRISSSSSLSQGTLILDLIRSKWLGLVFEIPLVEMLHYLSRSNAQSLDWIGWRLSEGPWLGLLSAHSGHVWYGTAEQVLLPCLNLLNGWFLGLSLIVYCVLWTLWPSLVEVIAKHRIIILISIFQLK